MGDTSSDRGPVRGELINSNRLHSTGQEATDPRDQRPAHTNTDELHDADVMVNPVERFTEV